MQNQQVLTIGHVPKDHAGGRISCGDPDGSGTQEITLLVIDYSMVTCLECTGFSYDGSSADWFSPNDNLWIEIAQLVSHKLEKVIDAETLYELWAFIMDEPAPNTKIRDLESEFGEFLNHGEFNDKFYFRYQEFEDDDVTREEIFYVN
jgi:hypothetical protein